MLHDGLSDMIEGGRLTEAAIPDDYRWLVDSLAALTAAKPVPVVEDDYVDAETDYDQQCISTDLPTCPRCLTRSTDRTTETQDGKVYEFKCRNCKEKFRAVAEHETQWSSFDPESEKAPEPVLYPIGTQLKSLLDEIDDDDEMERTTPAGSLWRVVALEQSGCFDARLIVCDATGATIVPSVESLDLSFEIQAS